MEDWGRARPHLEFARRSGDPDSLSLSLMLAECAYREGRYDQALSYYSQVSRYRPSDPDASRGAGVCLRALGRTAEADSAFQRASRVAAGRFYPAQDQIRPG